MSDTPREPPPAPPASPESPSPPPEGPVIDAAGWFDGRREVCIEYAGTRYRLRLTRRNKLILQK